jgi:quercetin dioxygenase-like cupin family protein
VEGEMELTINGVTKIYRKGDTYDIPDGAPHSGKFNTRVRTIDCFSQPDRYKLKST